MSSEKKETPQARYERLHVKSYRFKCVDTTEADIIARLDAQPNKMGYIKRLIREDIAREGHRHD